jgi:hypothetical protein
VDRKVGFGLAVDFLWNVQSKIERDSTSTHYKTISNQQTYMIPVMGFIFIDPVPDLIVHPVARFQIGYNSMLYTAKMDSTLAQNSPQTLSPYFYGLILKASIDALYNLGKNSALFLGLEYQWANTSTANTQNGLFDQRDMSGVGLRAGFRVTL